MTNDAILQELGRRLARQRLDRGQSAVASPDTRRDAPGCGPCPIRARTAAAATACVGAAHPSMEETFLAAKVYRPRMFRNLRNDHAYRQGREILTPDGRPVVAVLPLGPETAAKALGVTRGFSEKGIIAPVEVTGRSLKAGLKWAGKIGAQVAVIIGEAELAAAETPGQSGQVEHGGGIEPPHGHMQAHPGQALLLLGIPAEAVAGSPVHQVGAIVGLHPRQGLEIGPASVRIAVVQ